MKSKEPKTIEKKEKREIKESNSKEKQTPLQKIYLSPIKLKKDASVRKSHDVNQQPKTPIINVRKINSPYNNITKKRISGESYNSISRSNKSKSKSKDKNIKLNVKKKKQANLRIRQSYVNIQKGNLSEAYKDLRDLYTNNHFQPEIGLYLGMIAQKRKKVKEAQDYYRQYIKVQRRVKNKELVQYLNLARCLYFLEEYESAIKNCSSYLDIEPSQQVLQLKGKSLLKLKKSGQAMDSFFKALQINKQNPNLFEGLGDCYRESEAYEMALQQYDEALKRYTIQNIRILQKKLECYQKVKDKRKIKQIKNIIKNLSKESPSKLSKREQEDTSFSSSKSKDLINIKVNLIKKQEDLKIDDSIIAQEEFTKGNYESALSILNDQLQMKKRLSFRNFNLRAQLYFQIQDFDRCENDIFNALQYFEKEEKQPHQNLYQFAQAKKQYNMMKIMMNRLKEINAYSLTQSEDYRIMNRRKRCLGQALKAFQHDRQGSQKTVRSKLSQIQQQNSLINSSIFYNAQVTVFRLKNIRNILANWANNKFSINSLERTTDLAFKMVKSNMKDFSILPLHIIYSFLQPQNRNKSFKEMNKQIGRVLSRMCEKYPPSEKSISRSCVKSFDISWQPKEKINLFKPDTHFNSFKELHRAIQKLADEAEKERTAMDKIGKQVCENKNGFNFKSCLKIQKDYFNEDLIQERVLCRVVEKILSKDIKNWKDEIFSGIQIKEGKNVQYYFDLVNNQWENTIDFILQKKKKGNEPICFYVYDLIRAKCMYNNVTDIINTCKEFMNLHERKDIFLLQIDNRLAYKTKDIVLKYKVKNIVGELQLALEFESLQNQFNHGLYELYRSQFGPFFASIMWFSGFGLKKNRLFFKEKLKWKLQGLEHLRKFIYEDQIFVEFLDHPNMKLMKIEDYEIALYEMSFTLLKKQAPFFTISGKERFVMKAVQNNFLDEQIIVTIRVQNTTDFIKITDNGMNIIQLQDSVLASQDYQLRVRFSSGKNDVNYDKKIKECLINQNKVVQLMVI